MSMLNLWIVAITIAGSALGLSISLDLGWWPGIWLGLLVNTAIGALTTSRPA